MMKLVKINLWFLLIVLFTMNCKTDVTASRPGDVTGKWQLVKRETSGLRPVAEASLPDYKEYYELDPDHTFRKYRSDGWEATGVWAEKSSPEGDFVELFYEDDTVRGSCTMGKTYLKKSEKGMLVESSLPCDGDILYFDKVK